MKENLTYPVVNQKKNLTNDESGRGPLNSSRECGTKILVVYGKDYEEIKIERYDSFEIFMVFMAF